MLVLSASSLGEVGAQLNAVRLLAAKLERGLHHCSTNAAPQIDKEIGRRLGLGWLDWLSSPHTESNLHPR